MSSILGGRPFGLTRRSRDTFTWVVRTAAEHAARRQPEQEAHRAASSGERRSIR